MITGGIQGIGVDLVETHRMRDCIERWGARFVDRVFTRAEQAYCQIQAAPWVHYAARFAVKEAIAKACGTGIGGALGWLDMSVERDTVSGAPQVVFSAAMQRRLAQKGIQQVWISLSHTTHYAVGQAVLGGGHSVDQKEPAT